MDETEETIEETSEEAQTEATLPDVAFWWQTPEYQKRALGGDWYFYVWAVTITIASISLILNNFYLSIIIVLGAVMLTIIHSREPDMINIAFTKKGLHMGETFTPFTSMEGYSLRSNIHGNAYKLLLQNKSGFRKITNLPLPLELETEDLLSFLGLYLDQLDIEESLVDTISDRFHL